jgi:hypothetical protein
MDEIPIYFKDITLGMKLKDNEGHCCVVKKITNDHNIVVQYTWGTVGGYGFICMDSSSKLLTKI